MYRNRYLRYKNEYLYLARKLNQKGGNNYIGSLVVNQTTNRVGTIVGYYDKYFDVKYDDDKGDETVSVYINSVRVYINSPDNKYMLLNEQEKEYYNSWKEKKRYTYLKLKTPFAIEYKDKIQMDVLKNCKTLEGLTSLGSYMGGFRLPLTSEWITKLKEKNIDLQRVTFRELRFGIPEQGMITHLITQNGYPYWTPDELSQLGECIDSEVRKILIGPKNNNMFHHIVDCTSLDDFTNRTTFIGTGLTNAVYYDNILNGIFKVSGDSMRKTQVPLIYDTNGTINSNDKLINEYNEYATFLQQFDSFIQIKGYVTYKNIIADREIKKNVEDFIESPIFEYYKNAYDIETRVLSEKLTYSKIGKAPLIDLLNDLKNANKIFFFHGDLQYHCRNIMFLSDTKKCKIIDIEIYRYKEYKGYNNKEYMINNKFTKGDIKKNFFIDIISIVNCLINMGIVGMNTMNRTIEQLIEKFIALIRDDNIYIQIEELNSMWKESDPYEYKYKYTYIKKKEYKGHSDYIYYDISNYMKEISNIIEELYNEIIKIVESN